MPQETVTDDDVLEPTIPKTKTPPDLPDTDFFAHTSHKPAYPTGSPDSDLEWRVEGIHLIGVLHRQPESVDRYISAITRYNPDIVAVEAVPRAIDQRVQMEYEPTWPPDNEVEAAMWVATHNDTIAVSGIDLPQWTAPPDAADTFPKVDCEIFQQLGLINNRDELTSNVYLELNLDLIRQWREHTKNRIPKLYEDVLMTRDAVMAGRLHELYHQDSVDTIVAAVGLQHLPGILDHLQIPYLVPDTDYTRPPMYYSDGTVILSR